MTGQRPKRRRRGKSPKKIDPAIGVEHEVEIERIGSGGDGVAHIDGRPVYIPLTLPGDRLRVRLTAKRADGYAAEISNPSKQTQRVVPATPACPHFGRCGGCQLQHLPQQDYVAWKEQQVEAALASRGLTDIDIRPLIQTSPTTRRRLRLAAGGRMPDLERSPGTVQRASAGRKFSVGCEPWQPMGFRARNSREIVQIESCPVAMPSLVALLPPLQALLHQLDLAAKGAELHLTATETGIDLLLESALSPNLADLEALGAFAETHDLARLAFRQDAGSIPGASSAAEPIAARRPATVFMGTVPVDLPIGAFLQATKQAEAAMRAAATEAIGDSQKVADLFSGCGAFGLPLAAEGRHVVAFERDRAMVEALKTAARTAGIEHRLKAEQRDLDRQPLDRTDLENLDAAIVDPPRAGAVTQATVLASSGVEKIAMVSCNPATFARDARLLIDGGYRLTFVQPIDAFLWSAQIELVGAFERHIPS